jgi:hypothetical protein
MQKKVTFTAYSALKKSKSDILIKANQISFPIIGKGGNTAYNRRHAVELSKNMG